MAGISGEVTVRVDRCARAFIWYMLSNTIFANGSLTVCLHLLGELVLDWVSLTDWGLVGLAACYHGMDKACRDSNALEGFGIVFEVRSSPHNCPFLVILAFKMWIYCLTFSLFLLADLGVSCTKLATLRSEE